MVLKFGVIHTKKYIDMVITLQKKAIGIAHKRGSRDHTNILFVRSRTLKVEDLIKFKILQIMYKAMYNQLPSTIQEMFSKRNERYNLRRKMNFKSKSRRTCLKSKTISRKGVDL